MTPDHTSPQGPATSPARTPVRWSGRKTAVGAVLAIGIAAGGGVAAAHTFPQGSLTSGEQHGFGHGGPGGPGMRGDAPDGSGMPGMPGMPGSSSTSDDQDGQGGQNDQDGQGGQQPPAPQAAPGGNASPDAVLPSRPEDEDSAAAAPATKDI